MTHPTLKTAITKSREPEHLIDLSADDEMVRKQIRWLGHFHDAALVQAQEAESDFMAEFWLSEARHYRFEIMSARAVLVFRDTQGGTCND